MAQPIVEICSHTWSTHQTPIPRQPTWQFDVIVINFWAPYLRWGHSCKMKYHNDVTTREYFRHRVLVLCARIHWSPVETLTRGRDCGAFVKKGWRPTMHEIWGNARMKFTFSIIIVRHWDGAGSYHKPSILQSQQHGCWWLGEARSQCISRIAWTKTKMSTFLNNMLWKVLTCFQGFLFTQVLGHSLIKILKVLDISKLQDNFCIYWCEFYMPLVHLRSKCPVTKFGQQKPWF